MIDNRVRKMAEAAGALLGENRELVDAEMLRFSSQDRAGLVVYTVRLRVDYGEITGRFIERLTRKDKGLISKHQKQSRLISGS